MNAKQINIIDDPGHFVAHAGRVMGASNISLDRKQQWLAHHLMAMVELGSTGLLDPPYLEALACLGQCCGVLDSLQKQEDQRQRMIELAMERAAEEAAMQDWKIKMTAFLNREAIEQQRQRDLIAEQKELAREANIRLNRSVDCWQKPKAQWFRMVPALSRGRFQDTSAQGAD